MTNYVSQLNEMIGTENRRNFYNTICNLTADYNIGTITKEEFKKAAAKIAEGYKVPKEILVDAIKTAYEMCNDNMELSNQYR